MSFDPSKPVQTRDGRPVRILCTDRQNEFPIVALVGERQSVAVYPPDGSYGIGKMNDSDLINIEPSKWANVYPDYPPGRWHSTRQGAEENADGTRIAILELRPDGEIVVHKVSS